MSTAAGFIKDDEQARRAAWQAADRERRARELVARAAWAERTILSMSWRQRQLAQYAVWVAWKVRTV